MATTFEVKKGFELEKKLTVDGKEYESLDQVPAQHRRAIEDALTSGKPSTTIRINGETISNVEELPPWLRGILLGLADIAAKGAASGESSALSDDVSASEPGAVRPEPLIGAKALIVLVVLAAIVFWLVRSVI